MAGIVSGLSMILAKIAAAVAWIGSLAVAAFTAAWLMGTDLFCWLFAGVMDVAISAAAGLDLSGITAYAADWSSLPSELVTGLAAVGAGQALGVVVAACIIRITLQLIPFTRLGS